MSAPTASYRLQLRGHGVDLAAARRLLPYLARLGVSHLYLSPVQRARAGSTHGYDVTDPREIDPALGGEPALLRLAAEGRRHGVALLADVVPNHMAAHPDNPFFADVLARGPASRCAAWFDVDWEAADGRIVLPVLAASPRTCLQRGEIGLVRTGDEIRLRVGGLVLPLAGEGRPRGTRASRAEIARLLGRQHYELADWRRVGDRINYRRFFNVNELIAVRADEAPVFAESHALLARLLGRGVLSGLRVDHVDGLADPEAYLQRLRRVAPQPHLVLVEKILAPDEALPATWPVDGTTGYEYLNAAESLFLDPDGCEAIERGWARRVRTRRPFDATARAAKARMVQTRLAPELSRAVRSLRAACPASVRPGTRATRDALVAFASHLAVYRAYPLPGGLLPEERRRVRAALRGAECDGAPPSGLAALRRALLSTLRREDALTAARRVMQLCVSAAAKGVEDTAFYAHAPLLSRAEVGGEPGHPVGDAAARFHDQMAERTQRPRGLLAGSTHDTKRSADVRARLDVLSERPGAWLEAVDRWRRQNAALRRRLGGPDVRTELYFYQTLVSIWPLGGLSGMRAAERRLLSERIDVHMEKAAREAKRETSWTNQDERFEAALRAFVRGALLPAGGHSAFLRDVDRFARALARPGLWNGLARRLLQYTAPGIPDLYQGDETWRFELVDPDNRRPVDFGALARSLRRLERFDAGAPSRRERLLARLVRRPEDERLPLWLARRALAVRRADPDLFLSGRYQPLRAEGDGAPHVLAFARRRGERAALVVVPRLCAGLVAEPGAPPVGEATWAGTRLLLPAGLAGRRLTCAFSGRTRTAAGRWIALSDALPILPVGLWTAGPGHGPGQSRAERSSPTCEGQGRGGVSKEGLSAGRRRPLSTRGPLGSPRSSADR